MHARFMCYALEQAQKAFDEDEVPVGAVVVTGEGEIIAQDYNRVEQRKTQNAHAEMLALAQAGAKIGDWRLNGCWLYVTLEPCAMCFNALVLNRVEGVVFGARSPLFGYHLDKVSGVSLYNDRSFSIEVVEGVCSEKSVELLQSFFKNKRGKSGRSEGWA